MSETYCLDQYARIEYHSCVSVNSSAEYAVESYTNDTQCRHQQNARREPHSKTSD